MARSIHPIARLAVAVMLVVATAVLVTADPPTTYPSTGAKLIKNLKGHCMRLRTEGDPWFDACRENDPLDFESHWKLVQKESYYYNVVSVRYGTCITQHEKQLLVMPCDDNRNKHWRWTERDDNTKVKFVSRLSDEDEDPGFECFSSDSWFGYVGHAIRETCNGGSDRQKFTMVDVPALPRV